MAIIKIESDEASPKAATPMEDLKHNLVNNVLRRVNDPGFLNPAYHMLRGEQALEDTEENRAMLVQAQSDISRVFEVARIWADATEAANPPSTAEANGRMMKELQQVTDKYKNVLHWSFTAQMDITCNQVNDMLVQGDERLQEALKQYKQERTPKTFKLDNLSRELMELANRPKMKEVSAQLLAPPENAPEAFKGQTVGGYLSANISALRTPVKARGENKTPEYYAMTYDNVEATMRNPYVWLQLDSVTQDMWERIEPQLRQIRDERIEELTYKSASVPPPLAKRGATLG